MNMHTLLRKKANFDDSQIKKRMNYQYVNEVHPYEQIFQQYQRIYFAFVKVCEDQKKIQQELRSKQFDKDLIAIQESYQQIDSDLAQTQLKLLNLNEEYQGKFKELEGIVKNKNEELEIKTQLYRSTVNNTYESSLFQLLLPRTQQIFYYAFDDFNRLLISSEGDNFADFIRFYSTNNQHEVQVPVPIISTDFDREKGKFTALTCLGKQGLIAWGNQKGQCQIFNFNENKRKLILPSQSETEIIVMKFFENNCLLLGTEDGFLKKYNLISHKLEMSSFFQSPITCIEQHDQRDRIVAGHRNGSVRIYILEQNQMQLDIACENVYGHLQTISSIALPSLNFQEKNYIATYSSDLNPGIALVCLTKKQTESTLAQTAQNFKQGSLTNKFNQITFGPYDEFIISGSDDLHVYVWAIIQDSDNQTFRLEFISNIQRTPHIDSIIYVYYDAENDYLISADQRGNMLYWNNFAQSDVCFRQEIKLF